MKTEMNNLPIWLQQLWELDKALAKRAEIHYLKLLANSVDPTVRQLFIVRGVSGSGKTTVANAIVGKPSVATADDFFYKAGDGEYKFDFTKLGAAHGYCKGKVESLMKKETPKIAMANTTTKTGDMKPYMKLAEKYGYMVFVLTVENHHGGKNQHNVPEASLAKMESQLMNSIKLR